MELLKEGSLVGLHRQKGLVVQRRDLWEKKSSCG